MSFRPAGRLVAAIFAAVLAAGLLGCGGRLALSSLLTPTPSPAPTSTGTITLQPSDTPTPSPIPPTPTAGPSHTLAASDTPTFTPTITDTITPGPSPTPTRTGTPTRTPTRTRIPTRTRTPSRTPTITLTPTITNTPTPPPPRPIHFAPGLLSRVLSPIKAVINAIPGDDGLVRLGLIGEDGRTIYHVDIDYNEYRGRSITFYPEIPYQIQSMAETARPGGIHLRSARARDCHHVGGCDPAFGWPRRDFRRRDHPGTLYRPLSRRRPAGQRRIAADQRAGPPGQ